MDWTPSDPTDDEELVDLLYSAEFEETHRCPRCSGLPVRATRSGGHLVTECGVCQSMAFWHPEEDKDDD